MPKVLRIVALVTAGLLVVGGAGLYAFFYKIRYGFPRYETEAPALAIPDDRPAVLVFSKTTAFRHAEAIPAGEAFFTALGEREGYFVYATEEGGVFNAGQLARFDLVVFNNATGPGLTDEQRADLAAYVEEGGGLLAIHGAGDNSRAWPWWIDNVVGAVFSHHPLDPQFQTATVALADGTYDAAPPMDATLRARLAPRFEHLEEWYVFDRQPSAAGFSYVYAIDGESIDPNGNLLWMRDRDFGMGPVHPVAWHRAVGEGRTAYTSLGHRPEAFAAPEVQQLLEGLMAYCMGATAGEKGAEGAEAEGLRAE